MRRRAFLQAYGSAVITWPMLAWAQKDMKLPLVAVNGDPLLEQVARALPTETSTGTI